MAVRVDRLSFVPVALLAGVAAALIGLGRLVQLVGQAQDLEEPET